MNKILIEKIVNVILWIWSHCPIMCLSDDNNFATVTMGNIKNAHLRISLLNIMLGDSIFYIISFDVEQKSFSFIKVLHLIDLDGNFLKDEEIERIQSRFQDHIKNLTDDDLEIEKEKLLYHIEREEQRIDASINKINIYTTILLTGIPIVLAIINFDIVKRMSIVLLIMLCMIVYGLLNICLFIFRTIKVRGIKKSRFADLRASDDRRKEIVKQYQYDWQQLKYKAQLFVSFVLNLQEWIIFVLVLTVGISVGISMQKQRISLNAMDTSESVAFTINEQEMEAPYSQSSVDWKTVILDVERKQCTSLIVLTNKDEIPVEIKALKKYKNLQIDIVIDKQLGENIIKLVEVN